MKPRVGILTTLYAWDQAYSLVSVIEAQLESLAKYGYNPVLLVHDNFADDAKVPAGVEIRKVVPRFSLVDYSSNQAVTADFEDQVQKATEEIYKALHDVEIVIAHDIIFQGWFLPYAVAIHEIAKRKSIKWLHWTHSVPNAAPTNLSWPHTARYTLPPNSKLVYLNNHGLIRAAESYGIWPKDVRIAYNPVDPRLYYNLHPVVKGIIDKYGILDAKFVQVYPVSATRMVDGKQLPVLIEIFADLKKLGHSVKLIVANAHANAEREKKSIRDMQELGVSLGLNATELIFTSLEGKEYELGIPREAVSQLFQLSNLFVFPSMSENCPLILLEAMLAKCLLVLNSNVGPLRELAQDSALYFQFGSIDDHVEYNPSRETFLQDVARIIVSEFSTNRALKANFRLRKDFNYDKLFVEQLEPLLNEK